MILHNNAAVLVTVAVYLFVLFSLNIYSSRNSNQLDYSAGGRKMGAWTMALSAGASDNSSWLFLGLPGAAYLFGFGQIWIIIGLVIGCYCNWLLVAPYLREYVKNNPNVITIPEFLSNKFYLYKNLIKIISSFIIVFFSLIYIGANFVGLAVLLEKFGFFSYHDSIIFTAIFTIIYVSIGGFSGVCTGDILQALFMIFSSLFVSIVCFMNINLSELATHSYETFFNENYVQIISLSSWGLGYFGQPHILSRFMAIGDVSLVEKSRKISLTWSVICWVFVLLSGVAGSLYFINPLNDPETVFILLAQNLLNKWFIGIVFVSIGAAIISTITAQIMVSSDIIARDLLSSFLQKRKDSSVIIINRLIVLLVVFLSSLLSWHYDSTVISLLSYAWSGLGASFGPIILLCALKVKITDIAALIGIISGSFAVVAWRCLEMHNYIYEMFPAFAISCIVILIVSFFTREDK